MLKAACKVVALYNSEKNKSSDGCIKHNSSSNSHEIMNLLPPYTQYQEN